MESAGKQPNTRIPARQLATMALFIALGAVLSFIEFPLLPGAAFLKYDAALVPALLAGFAYGPLAGCIVATLTPWIHALMDGNLWGGLMNNVINIAYLLPAALIYKASRGLKKPASGATMPGINTAAPGIPAKGMSGNIALFVGLAVACVLAVAAAIAMNLVVTPIYTGMPLQAIIDMILPILLPFNILKTLLNSVLGFVLMKSLHSFIK